MTKSISFVIFDDVQSSEKNWFIGKRKIHEVKKEFHDMKLGEIRMITKTIGIIRDK